MSGVIQKCHISKNLINYPDYIENMQPYGSSSRVSYYEYTLKPNTAYTLSTNYYGSNNACWFISEPNETASSTTNGVTPSNTSRTYTTDSTGKLWIWGRTVATGTAGRVVDMQSTDWVMLNEGLIALPYEPYGTIWNDIPYTRLETATDTITALPKTTYNDGTNATVAIKGNMQQSGTPTPSSPIIPSECGEKTENLFDGELEKGVWDDVSTLVQTTSETFRSFKRNMPAGTYTLSFPNSVNIVRLIADGTLTKNLASNVNSYTVTTTTDGDIGFSFRLTTSSTTPWDNENVMFNVGSTATPYEPYGQYKLPIASGAVTTNAYLGEVQSTRKIKKLALTGSEEWGYNQGNTDENGYYFIDLGENVYVESTDCICSHFEYALISVSNTIDGFRIATKSTPYPMQALIIRCKDISMSSSPATFKQWLYNQYAAGTPVTVWYVLAEPTTGIVNQPIRKIGDYVDTVSNPVSIPTTAGGQTFDVDTTLKPSEVNLTYHGWHEHEPLKRENGAWS